MTASKSPPRSSRRWFFRGAALLVASTAALAVSEVAVRLYLRASPPRLRIDAELGWRCVESYSWTGFVKDAGGRARRITYTTDDRGFRASAPLRAGRRRLLVVGDSFTQAADASDDETYFALLGARLDVDVYAYGAGGYGTLQELLVLEHEIDRISPDLVLLQFCTNDFINDDLALETASRWDNNGMVRPYLADDGTIVRALPKEWRRLRSLGDGSKLAWAAFVCWDRFGARWGATVEDAIAKEGAAHPGFAHATRIAAELLARMKRRCGERPLLVFPVDEREPYGAALVAIAARAGVPLLPGVPEALKRARRSGTVIHAADFAHWNDAGHRICAETLAHALAAQRGLALAR